MDNVEEERKSDKQNQEKPQADSQNSSEHQIQKRRHNLNIQSYEKKIGVCDGESPMSVINHEQINELPGFMGTVNS